MTMISAPAGDGEPDAHVGADQQAAGVGGGVLACGVWPSRTPARTENSSAVQRRPLAGRGGRRRGTRRRASTSLGEQVGEDAVLA